MTVSWPQVIPSLTTLFAFGLVGFVLHSPDSFRPPIQVFTGVVLGWQLGICFCVYMMEGDES